MLEDSKKTLLSETTLEGKLPPTAFNDDMEALPDDNSIFAVDESEAKAGIPSCENPSYQIFSINSIHIYFYVALIFKPISFTLFKSISITL
jgi:hypothetical protein